MCRVLLNRLREVSQCTRGGKEGSTIIRGTFLEGFAISSLR